MPNYKRQRQPGGTWFFTVNLADRKQRWLVDHIDRLRHAVATTQQNHPFAIEAAVILPDHLHMVWRLPPNDSDFSTRWRLIKSHFVRGCSFGESTPRDSLQSKNERGVWQRRFYEHAIRDAHDLATHIDYIHFNPVKHGHAVRPADWPHSSIHRFIRDGLLTPGWGVGVPPKDLALD